MLAIRILKEIVFAFPGSITGVHALITSLPELTTKGGVEVETFIPHVSEEHGQDTKQSFRTLIQLDGDMIVHVPKPDLFPGDEQWDKSYTETLSTHQRRVWKKLSQFKGLYTIPWILGSVLSLPILILPERKGFFRWDSLSSYIWIVLYFAATYLLRFAARYGLRIALGSFFAGKLGRFLRRYISRNYAL